MNINIKAKGFDLTPAIREYTEEKMSHIERFVQKWDMEGGVELNFEVAKTTGHHNKGDVFYAEANLKVPGKLLRAEKEAEDLHAAIDAVKDMLAEEVKQYKEITEDHKESPEI